ncbi:MAG: tRNA (cytosine(32)/uridine(32)-2'-O)-methyltransferase TrmJ [Gammaproteobacteria bacterium]|nr:tRNA (cytosine(32)/uridine(32)-2'-O)-methyltransferase TrmJ [Gammaproteobacteria bacterium]MDH5777063.1 tRNA (cytosine(32)/uridine(32)-2'-O)-methyltransferase TrmJ [Gammaproteobacteria bacterium]
MAVKFENIRIVLVETSHPGNIGSVCRAMKNMCLDQLYLVRPQNFPDPEGKSKAMAASARDVLANIKIVDSLDEAVAECVHVVGASARLRSIPWPIIDPRECVSQLAEIAENDQVALVFGREDRGLTNEEMERCNALVNIPANPEYSSLNIAAAVQVLCYEINMLSFLQGEEEKRMPDFYDHPRATSDEVEGLYGHFESALTALGFHDPDNPRQLMRRLRRLFNRAGLDKMEVNILRGILTAAEKANKEKPVNTDKA